MIPAHKPNVPTFGVALIALSFAALSVDAGAAVAKPIPDTKHFQITDDAALTSACLRARDRFLANEPQWQAGKKNRLDFTLLILRPDGTVLRGGHGQEEIAYPASCVKLPFMAAAMQWCRENGLPPTALDSAVAPMITVSSNEATGEVVDAITGAPNIDDLTTTSDHRFRQWLEQRRYTERFLEGRGLLGNQTILHKTYPTNSGRMPAGAEGVASRAFGGNRMQPRLSASLMLEIAKGALEPQAHGYMMQILRHERHEDDSIIGWGLPPGSEYFNKPGVAYDTCEDIAFVRLPNGREFVLAVYSNSWERRQPIPHDANRLGRFVEILLAETGLVDGLQTRYFVNASAAAGGPVVESTVAETTRVVAADHFHKPAKSGAVVDDRPRQATVWRGQTTGTAVQVAMEFELPVQGHYELALFHPASRDFATSAVVEIQHADGKTTVALDQSVAERRPRVLGTYRFGPERWKSPAPGPKPEPAQGRFIISAPPGQKIVTDALRAQLLALNPVVARTEDN